MSLLKKNNIIQYSFLILMLGIATIILAGPPIRILSEYLVHIMFGFFFLGLFFLVIDQKKLLITSFAVCGMLCVFLKNESNNDLIQPQINYNPSVSIVHYNLSNISDQNDLILSIEQEDPDLLSFQEYTPDWIKILETELSKSYQFNATLVRIDPYGKAIYSKLPILSIDTLNKSSFQDLKIKCSLQGNDFFIYSNYITPSLDKLSTKNAINQLRVIGEDVKSESIPILTFGEYNMVYWANEISKFRAFSKLNNSRKDVIPASFKMPYDHIFYSNELECIGEGSVLNTKNEKIGYKGTYQLKIDLTSAVN